MKILIKSGLVAFVMALGSSGIAMNFKDPLQQWGDSYEGWGEFTEVEPDTMSDEDVDGDQKNHAAANVVPMNVDQQEQDTKAEKALQAVADTDVLMDDVSTQNAGMLQAQQSGSHPTNSSNSSSNSSNGNSGFDDGFSARPSKKRRVDAPSDSLSSQSFALTHSNGHSNSNSNSQSLSGLAIHSSPQSNSSSMSLVPAADPKKISQMTELEQLLAACAIVSGEVNGKALPTVLVDSIKSFLPYSTVSLAIPQMPANLSLQISDNGHYCAYGPLLINLFNQSVRDFTISGNAKSVPTALSLPSGSQFPVCGHFGKQYYPCVMNYTNNECRVFESFKEGNFASYPLANAQLSQDHFSVYAMGKDMVVRKFAWNLKTGKRSGDALPIIKIPSPTPGHPDFAISQNEEWIAFHYHPNKTIKNPAGGCIFETDVALINIKQASKGTMLRITTFDDAKNVISLRKKNILPAGKVCSIQFTDNKLCVVGEHGMYVVDPVKGERIHHKEVDHMHAGFGKAQCNNLPVFSLKDMVVAQPTQNQQNLRFGSPLPAPGYTIAVSQAPGGKAITNIVQPDGLMEHCAVSPKGSVVASVDRERGGVNNRLMLHYDMVAYMKWYQARLKQCNDYRARKQAQATDYAAFLQFRAQQAQQQNGTHSHSNGSSSMHDKGDPRENGQ